MDGSSGEEGGGQEDESRTGTDDSDGMVPIRTSRATRVMIHQAMANVARFQKGRSLREPDVEQIRLPFDVIGEIAWCLLARLNLVSRTVHEVTLPALYETTDYFEKEDFTDSVKVEHPKGWKWTQYLSLGQISHALLCQQQRCLDNLWDTTDDDIEYNSSFPRLRLAYFQESSKNFEAISLGFRIDIVDVIVNIYKPTTFEELQARS